MYDQDVSPEGADHEEDVSEDQTEGTENEDEEGETEGQAEETGDEKPERPRETSKERRAREKEHKAHLRKEAQKFRAEADAATSRRQQITDAGQQDAAPVERDFKDYSDFVAAKAVWTYAQSTAKRSAAEEEGKASEALSRAEAIQQQERQIDAALWEAQADEAKTRYADFDAVVKNPLVPISPGVAQIIFASENAADVAYAISKDHALARELSGMQPVEAALAIGRIGATIAPPKPRTSQAPAPISPVKGGAAAAKDPAKMSMSEYKAARKAGKI